MPDGKTGGSRWVPDIRPDEIGTFQEKYGDTTATYKAVNVHPIINRVLDKLAFFRTHAAAVWYNKLAGKTVADKFGEVDTALSSLNAKSRTGSYVPTLISGGDSLAITTGSMQYYIEGRLCFISCAIWGTITNPNSDPVKMSLPFAPVSRRSYGWVGYHNSAYDVMYAMCAEGEAEIALETPTKAGSKTVKGTEMDNMTIQFSIVFAI